MKRIFDFVAAVTLLIVFGPVMIAVALLIYWKIGAPVLFRQMRPGLHMKPFWIYKFRTMTEQRDSRGELLPDEARLTRLGLFLRRLSLDELPQLFNVLLGEMSLVGPRPLLMRYIPYFTEREKSRFSIRPGITGLAQISGRNQLPWSIRLEMDADYVERWSFALDMEILAKSLLKVCRRENVADYPSLELQDLDIERGGSRHAAKTANGA
ncbi:sugar transferase [Paenibacillus thalictri]|uniref:Sugar transferase n=1 Tax=Paenibacillus thalictri TaxID=2527873 RepID=A0A4Q9DJ17_9BACL|nr:sugar transferase [Paenibacillus thalictri]TBL70838.1 sugar transferase [Paenibacillus thalictri]